MQQNLVIIIIIIIIIIIKALQFYINEEIFVILAIFFHVFDLHSYYLSFTIMSKR